MDAQEFTVTPGQRWGKSSVFVGDLTVGTLVAAVIAVCIGEMALAIPAVLNGLFQLDLGTSASQLTWISDAFLVPVTLLELTFGVLGDMFGRKRLLVGGALILAVGELISVLTPGLGSSTATRVHVLWTGQALSGIGAGALIPTSLAAVASATHNAQQRARVIAIYAASLSTGAVVSPVLGGGLARIGWGSDANASWRWCFVAVMGLALTSAVVSLVGARDSSAPEGRSLDWRGQITVAIGLFALMFAVIEASTAGWGSTQVIAGFIVAAVFMALFVANERRHASPLLQLELFRNRAFSITALVTVVGMFAYLGTAYGSSIRLAAIQGFSPLTTALAFVLLSGFTLVLLPVISYAMPRVNPHWLLGGGYALIAAGAFWVATLPVSQHSIVPMIAPLSLVGIGFAFSVSSVTAIAVNSVRIHLAGMASATTSLLRDFAFTLGPALVGAIALSRATGTIHSRVSANPALQHRLNAFYGSIAHVPPAQRAKLAAAIGAVKSGPLGANGVPATAKLPNGHSTPLNPLKGVAFHALGSGYSFGFLVCGSAAAVAAVIVLLFLRADPHHDADELTEGQELARPQAGPGS